MDDYPPCPPGCLECQSTLRIRDNEFYNTPAPTRRHRDCTVCEILREAAHDTEARHTLACTSASPTAALDKTHPEKTGVVPDQISDCSVVFGESVYDTAVAEAGKGASSTVIAENGEIRNPSQISNSPSPSTGRETNDILNVSADHNYTASPNRVKSRASVGVPALIDEHDKTLATTTTAEEKEEEEEEEEEEGDLATALLLLPHNPSLLHLKSLLAKNKLQQRQTAQAAKKLDAERAETEAALSASIARAGMTGQEYKFRGILYWGDGLGGEEQLVDTDR